MFRYDQYDRRAHTERADPPTSPYKPVDNIAKASLLIWDEHCVECAAPACYQTCDLYQIRPDRRCRRFSFGLYKNRQFPSLRGCGAEISFKKSAAIVSRGNASVEPIRSLLWKERMIEFCAPIVNVIGSLGNRLTNNPRWSYLTYILQERLLRWIHSRNQSNSKPEAFLLEVYNPTSQTIRMELRVNITKDPGTRYKSKYENYDQNFNRVPPFTNTVIFEHGYSRHEFGKHLLQSIIDSGLPFDVALIPEADTSARVVFLTADFVAYHKNKVSDRQRHNIKCIIWDLDNTIWDGVLLENEDVRPKPNVPELLKRLDERGILLGIASKNDHDHAWQRLEQLGIGEYFLYPQINWKPKSQNIKLIAERLNIGLDTFAFIDDSPFELDEVSRILPMVICINSKDVDGLLDDPRFSGSGSADATNRRQYYKNAVLREQEQAGFGNDYLGFLASCEIRLDVRHYTSKDYERVSELVQRTNQLNFSGRKYTRDQLSDIISNRNLEKYILICSDKYGYYGTVGFGIVSRQKDEIRVEDFMLSCRVQGKFIEQAFLNHLQEHHNPDHAVCFWVNYRETSRNNPAKQVLEKLHFEKRDVDDGMYLDLLSYPLTCDFIEVTCSIPPVDSS